MTSSQVPLQLSVVLPATFGADNTLYWRRSSTGSGPTHLTLALKSFHRCFDQRCVVEVVLVCPDDEVADMRRLLRSVTSDPRYRVVSERELVPVRTSWWSRLSREKRIPGWYLQQMLKLAFAEHARAPYYLILDSDIVCLRPCGPDLFRDGRPLAGIETLEDYQRIYTATFAETERGYKRKRRHHSNLLLGWQRPPDMREQYFSETPVIVHTQSVRDMLARVEAVGSRPWRSTLAEAREWTEYYLYFGYLEMIGKLDTVHALADPCCVLDLERSVWQATSTYAAPRLYDRAHFFGGASRGPFVAIQTWLDAKSWLPRHYANVDAFLRDLETWLDDELAKS